MRTLRCLSLVVGLAGCGGAGESLVGKVWNVEKNGVHAAIFGMVFDGDGNLVGNGLKTLHTHRYNVQKTSWEDLGGFETGTASIPKVDLEGNVYSYQDHVSGGTSIERGLYKLVGDKWEFAATYPDSNNLYAFSKGGTIWTAGGVVDGTPGKYQVSRKSGSADWEITHSGTEQEIGLSGKGADVKGVDNDEGGTVYITFYFGTRQVSPAGDQLSRLYGCDEDPAPEYCNRAALPHADQYGLTFGYGGLADQPGIYRVPPGETKPVFLTKFPEAYHVLLDMKWDNKGNLYYTGAEDYSGGKAVLHVLNAGSTEWVEVIDMPSKFFVLAVRGDGEVFAFDPADGTLAWLK